MSATIHEYIQPVSPNGQKSQGDMPKSQQRSRWRSLLAKASPSNWEHVIVNNKIDSVTMPKWVAVAVFGAMLTFGMASWWKSSSEHDTLIEIRTELRLAKEAQAEKDQTTNGKLADVAAWQGVVNGKLSEIKGMLSQQQIDALGRDSLPKR